MVSMVKIPQHGQFRQRAPHEHHHFLPLLFACPDSGAATLALESARIRVASDPAVLRFLLTRLSLIVPIFLGMTLVAFLLIRLVPGDPIETLAGERGIDPVRHAALLKEYGLDRPVLVQYGIYIGRVLHGDLGKSMITQEPVLREFAALFPATSSGGSHLSFLPGCR